MNGDIWNLFGGVIIIGLVVAALIIFAFVRRDRAASGTSNAVEENVSVPLRNTTIPAPAPVAGAALTAAQFGTEDETIAAISAAVYFCMSDLAPGVPYAISSIRPAAAGRPVWGFAGMQQNTRPF